MSHLRRRNVGFQAGNWCQKGKRDARPDIQLLSEQKIRSREIRQFEIRRQHSGDCGRTTVDLDHAAEYVAIPAEPALPEAE